MRGRPTCPTGQEKNSVEATGGSPPFFYFYKERLGTGSPPHPTRLRRPTFPPRGRLWGCATLPVHETTPPSPPSRWAGRYGRKIQGRRPGRKKERTLAGSPQPEKVGPGRKNLFLPGVLSSGFLPKKAGPPPGAGRATGRCAPRLRKSPDHPKGTQYPTAPPPGTGREPTWQVWTCGGSNGAAYRPRQAPGPSGATPTPSGQMKEKPPGKGSRFCASCSFFAPSRKNP